MYSKVYVEITNICNMHCSFCHGHSRGLRRMTKEEFACILEKLAGYTDCVGRTVTIDNTKFLVVGVLHDDEDSLTSLFTAGTCVAYIPYTTAVRVTSTVAPEIASFYGAAPQGGTVDTAADRLQ